MLRRLDLQQQRVQQVDLPVGGLSPSGDHVTPGRRWVADPLPLLALVAVAGVALALVGLPDRTLTWHVPALLGVVAAGLALSGST